MIPGGGYGFGRSLASHGYGIGTAVVIPSSGGGIGHGKGKKKPELCVISVDGQDYRVSLDNLQSFLERIREKPVEVVKKKKGRKSKKQIKTKPPKVVLKSAPIEYKMQIQASVDRSNEILRKIWEGNLTRLINEAEHEEAIALVLLMED